jgi:hypothetical protein
VADALSVAGVRCRCSGRPFLVGDWTPVSGWSVSRVIRIHH